MSEETDAIIKMSDQENTRIIHYQKERTKTTHVIFVMNGAIIALILFDKSVCGTHDMVFSIVLFLSGLFGMFLNAKYHERIHFHEKRLSRYYDELDKLLPKASMKQIREDVKKTFEKKYFYKETLWRPWVMINCVTLIIGIVLFILSFLNMQI